MGKLRQVTLGLLLLSLSLSLPLNQQVYHDLVRGGNDEEPRDEHSESGRQELVIDREEEVIVHGNQRLLSTTQKAYEELLRDAGSAGDGKAIIYNPGDKGEHSEVEIIYGTRSSTTSRVQIAGVTEKTAKETTSPFVYTSFSTSLRAKPVASTPSMTISADIRRPVLTTPTIAPPKDSGKGVGTITQPTSTPLPTTEKVNKPATASLSAPDSTTLHTTPLPHHKPTASSLRTSAHSSTVPTSSKPTQPPVDTPSSSFSSTSPQTDIPTRPRTNTSPMLTRTSTTRLFVSTKTSLKSTTVEALRTPKKNVSISTMPVSSQSTVFLSPTTSTLTSQSFTSSAVPQTSALPTTPIGSSAMATSTTTLPTAVPSSALTESTEKTPTTSFRPIVSTYLPEFSTTVLVSPTSEPFDTMGSKQPTTVSSTTTLTTTVPSTTTPTTTVPSTTTPTTTVPSTTTPISTVPSTTTPTTTVPSTTTPTTTVPSTTTPTTTAPSTTTPTTIVPSTTTPTMPSTTTPATTMPSTTTPTTTVPSTTTPITTVPSTTTPTTTVPSTTTLTTTVSSTTTPTTTVPSTTTPTTTVPFTTTLTTTVLSTTTPTTSVVPSTTTTTTTTSPTAPSTTKLAPIITKSITVINLKTTPANSSPTSGVTDSLRSTLATSNRPNKNSVTQDSNFSTSASSSRSSVTTPVSTDQSNHTAPFKHSSSSKTTSSTVTSALKSTTTKKFPRKSTTVSMTLNPRQDITRLTTAAKGKSTPQNRYTYLEVLLDMTWGEFCEAQERFKNMLLTILGELTAEQVDVLILENCCPTNCKRSKRSTDSQDFAEDFILVKVYIVNEQGMADDGLTNKVFDSIKTESKREIITDETFKRKIKHVTRQSVEIERMTEKPKLKNTSMTMPVIAAISAVMLVCIIGLVIISVVLHRRRVTRRRQRPMRSSIHHRDDNYSLNSFSLQSSFKRQKGTGRQSLRSVTAVNKGFVADEKSYCNAMTLSKLSTRSLEMDYLEEELKSIPSNMPKLSSLPPGAQAKNRYANVIPLEHSRVVLSPKTQRGGNQYINANYVTGYNGETKAYIATQAPLESTTGDFWTMIWETQSQVIVMLMNWEEDGQRRCADYLPESDGIHSITVHGDYEISMKKQIVREEFVFCSVTLKNMERNLCRDVVHFQYLDFPAKQAPSSVSSFLTFVKEIQPYMEVSHGPPVVHCSTGTGRTGTLLAIDICIQAYDDSRTVDIMNCIHKLRQDRAGAVHTTAHYAFIYKAMLEYANRTGGSNSPARYSSTTTLGGLET